MSYQGKRPKATRAEQEKILARIRQKRDERHAQVKR